MAFKPITSEIQPGSLVRLLSGGPAMTVDCVHEETVTVYWHDKNDILRVYSIPINLVTLVNKNTVDIVDVPHRVGINSEEAAKQEQAEIKLLQSILDSEKCSKPVMLPNDIIYYDPKTQEYYDPKTQEYYKLVNGVKIYDKKL